MTVFLLIKVKQKDEKFFIKIQHKTPLELELLFYFPTHFV